MSLSTLSIALDNFFVTAQANFPLVLTLWGGVIAVNLLNWVVFRGMFNLLGIWPRRVLGWIGIPFAPVLHGGPGHLFFNTPPFVVLSTLVLTEGLPEYIRVCTWVVLIGGGLTWLIGRKGVHIGASGLNAGLFAYMLTLAIERPTIVSLFAGGIALYYFGSILFSLLPSDENVSFEAHITGFLGGIAAAHLPFYGIMGVI